MSVKLLEQWSAVFGGSESSFHLALTTPEALNGRVGWTFAGGGRTIARGESRVSLQPNKPESVRIRLQVPEVKENVTFAATLMVHVFVEGQGNALLTLEHPLWVFSDDPFAGRQEWLKQLNILLLDPEGRTAKVLEAMKVPFEATRNVEAIEAIEKRFLIIGEGLSFDDYRSLPEQMMKAASRGNPVLCLAPSGGQLPIPGAEDVGLPSPVTLRLAQNAVIKELDKRLDADAWPPDGKVSGSGMVLKAARGLVVGEFVKGPAGWPWLEVRFKGKKGKLVVCSFGIIEKWETGPTPRFLLARILEFLNGNPKEESK